MTWEEYTRTMRKWQDDLTSYGAVIPEEIYCIALLQSSNLDCNMKAQLESMARAESADGKTLAGENVEEALLRFANKIDEKQEINFTEYTEEQLEEEIN